MKGARAISHSCGEMKAWPSRDALSKIMIVGVLCGEDCNFWWREHS